MSDWFYIGLGAASQVTNGNRPQQWNDRDGDLYLQMAGYNKIRQCELEEMARKNPSQFRELLGHERSPDGSGANPDFFTVDGRNYPTGLAKDISEILAREGYKYLKNIDIPAISDAIRDPNYRKVVGIRLNNGNIPNSYLMSPEREREWEYARSVVNSISGEIRKPSMFGGGCIPGIIVVASVLATLPAAATEYFGVGSWLLMTFVFSILGLMVWAFVSTVAKSTRSKAIIVGAILTYVTIVVIMPFIFQSLLDQIVSYTLCTVGLPFGLPLFIALLCLRSETVKVQRDPDAHMDAQQMRKEIEEHLYTARANSIKQIRDEIRSNPLLLMDIPCCNNIIKRRDEWDYTKDCNKGDFTNRYRFERYKSSFEIRAENEAERNEQLEKQRVQNIKDVCQMKEEALSLVHAVLQRLEHLNNPMAYDRIVRIQNNIQEETNNIESKSDEKILSIMSWLKLKKAEIEMIAKDL